MALGEAASKWTLGGVERRGHPKIHLGFVNVAPFDLDVLMFDPGGMSEATWTLEYRHSNFSRPVREAKVLTQAKMSKRSRSGENFLLPFQKDRDDIGAFPPCDPEVDQG
jgi:hypothetical protein